MKIRADSDEYQYVDNHAEAEGVESNPRYVDEA
jgi:hypothetical protein